MDALGHVNNISRNESSSGGILMRLMRLALAVGAVLTALSPATAATYLANYTISGISGPISSFSGSFRISYDPSVSLINDATPDAFSTTIGATTFTIADTQLDVYRGANATVAGGTDWLIGAFGKFPGDSNNGLSSRGAADFRVRFMLDSNLNLVSARGGYSNPSASFDTTDATGIVSLNVTAVPEPATWALLLGGFGLVGLTMRSRRKLEGAVA